MIMSKNQAVDRQKRKHLVACYHTITSDGRQAHNRLTIKEFCRRWCLGITERSHPKHDTLVAMYEKAKEYCSVKNVNNILILLGIPQDNWPSIKIYSEYCKLVGHATECGDEVNSVEEISDDERYFEEIAEYVSRKKILSDEKEKERRRKRELSREKERNRKRKSTNPSRSSSHSSSISSTSSAVPTSTPPIISNPPLFPTPTPVDSTSRYSEIAGEMQRQIPSYSPMLHSQFSLPTPSNVSLPSDFSPLSPTALISPESQSIRGEFSSLSNIPLPPLPPPEPVPTLNDTNNNVSFNTSLPTEGDAQSENVV